MKTKKIKNAPSLQSVLINPFYKGRIKKVKYLQKQADNFANSVSFARGELAYAVSQKLLKLVPKGPGRTLLEIFYGGSFIPQRSNPAYSMNLRLSPKWKTRRVTLLCELVNIALNRANFMDYGNIFFGNGCVILTEFGINHYLKTTDPESFLQNAIITINEAWAKDNNNLGSLAFDDLVDKKEKGQKFRILFKPGKEESKLI